MLKGSRGQKRPADVIGSAITVARLTIGETEEESKETLGRVCSRVAGTKAWGESMIKEERSAAAKQAAAARWS